MLRIRLFRVGKKNQPFFKIVVTDKKSPPRGGRPLEILGFYNPLTKEKGFKKERIQYWLSVGAKPSDTIYNLLVANGILKGKKIAVHKKPKPKEKKEEKEKPKKAIEKPEEKKEEKAPEPKEAKPVQKEEKELAKPKEEKTKEELKQEKIKQKEATEKKLEKKIEEKEKKIEQAT